MPQPSTPQQVKDDVMELLRTEPHRIEEIRSLWPSSEQYEVNRAFMQLQRDDAIECINGYWRPRTG